MPWRWLVSPLVALALLGLWYGVTAADLLPAFMLPAPGDVFEAFYEALEAGSLPYHIGVTLQEVLLGLASGLGVALSLGYLLAKFPLFERILAPYIVGLQAVPIVAIAPLLIIWFGSGTQSKIITCALIVFFPMLINTVVGMRQVEPDLRDLMRALNATRWQTFRYLEVPAALPVLLGGLKVSATLSVIGAVVGEFVGANAGLGFMINSARSVFDTPTVYVAVFTLTLMALALYGLVGSLERRLLAWQRRREQPGSFAS
ncbi:MAG: ABC transporter permease [Anaerolineae bacterium]|nr:ABC transporter permease [Anaerolineae bacterium]